MNRGFKRYFKESYKASLLALKKKDNYVRYLLFLCIELLSCILFFIKPIVNLASVRLVKIVKNEKRIVISKTIERGDDPKAFWTSIITIIMKGFLFIAIVLLHLLAIFVLAVLGYFIYAIISNSDYGYLVGVFALPAVVALLIFILRAKYLTVSTAYIVDTNPELGASKVLYASIASLKETGKKTLFLNDLIHGLIFVFITAIYTLVAYAVSFLPDRIVLPLTVFVVFAYLALILFFGPVLSLSHKMVKVSLFDDIVIDRYALKQRISGIRMIEFNKKAQMPIEQRLAAVFDDEDELTLEAKLFRKVLSSEEVAKIDEDNLNKARELIREKSKVYKEINSIDSIPNYDDSDGIPIENDELPIEEDYVYLEVDTIESDGE